MQGIALATERREKSCTDPCSASVSPRLLAGDPRLGIRAESAAAAATEAHDPEERTSSNPDSVPLEVLCGGRELSLNSDMENSSDTSSKSSSVSTRWRASCSLAPLSLSLCPREPQPLIARRH